jgi:hypothetical protein
MSFRTKNKIALILVGGATCTTLFGLFYVILRWRNFRGKDNMICNDSNNEEKKTDGVSDSVVLVDDEKNEIQSNYSSVELVDDNSHIRKKRNQTKEGTKSLDNSFNDIDFSEQYDNDESYSDENSQDGKDKTDSNDSSGGMLRTVSDYVMLKPANFISDAATSVSSYVMMPWKSTDENENQSGKTEYDI